MYEPPPKERKEDMQQIILRIARWLIKYVDGYSIHKNPRWLIKYVDGYSIHKNPGKRKK